MSRQYKKSIKAWAWQEKMSHRCTCQNCRVCFKRRKAKVAGGSQDASKRWHRNSDTPEMQTHGLSAKYALLCLTTKQLNQQRQRVLASQSRMGVQVGEKDLSIHVLVQDMLILRVLTIRWSIVWRYDIDVLVIVMMVGSATMSAYHLLCVFFCGPFITLDVADFLDPSPLSRSILFLLTSLDSLHHVWLRH